MNHTSDSHPWARAARAGDPDALSLYLTYPDRTLPDAYERTLPEVFPDLAPGNFTHVAELGRWVWTTFNRFQWDLDWSNPRVLVEMSRIVLFLADLGVDVLRLDAVAFTGKQLGTNCQNQPAAHLVAQALRAVLGMGAPATIVLAEAIVAPDDLVPYLGRHERERRECDLAYHNQLMVLGWSMLAEGRTTLARTALERMPAPPARTGWLTYVRCHDDIGWAISDSDAASTGGHGQGHRDFLSAFYRGDFPLSFAEGEPFGVNLETGDERTCGGTAALCGISQALRSGDDGALDMGIRRLLALYGIAFGWGASPCSTWATRSRMPTTSPIATTPNVSTTAGGGSGRCSTTTPWHGGTIRAASRAGCGTAFVCWWPLGHPVPRCMPAAACGRCGSVTRRSWDGCGSTLAMAGCWSGQRHRAAPDRPRRRSARPHHPVGARSRRPARASSDDLLARPDGAALPLPGALAHGRGGTLHQPGGKPVIAVVSPRTCSAAPRRRSVARNRQR